MWPFTEYYVAFNNTPLLSIKIVYNAAHKVKLCLIYSQNIKKWRIMIFEDLVAKMTDQPISPNTVSNS